MEKLLDKALASPVLVSGLGRLFGAPAPSIASPAPFDGSESESINKSIEALKKLDSELPLTLRNLVAVCEASPETLDFFKLQLNNYLKNN